MRFFSNEAKENTDDETVAEHDQDRAESDGGPVPQQRSGSPWSDTPAAVPVSDHDYRQPGNDTEDTLRRDDSEVRHDGDDLVPDSDREDDLDLPLDEHDRAGSQRVEGDLDTTAADSPAEGSTTGDRVGTADGAVDEGLGAEQRGGTTTTYGPDGSVTAVDDPADSSVDTAGADTDFSAGERDEASPVDATPADS